jgi:hypothetical protein
MPAILSMMLVMTTTVVEVVIVVVTKHRQSCEFGGYSTILFMLTWGVWVVATSGITPGYGDEVIFGDGTFIDGSTSELSADGPLREPYAVYCQGGTHWTHWALVLEDAIESLRQPEGK